MSDPAAELPSSDPAEADRLPFRIDFDPTSGKVVLWATVQQRRGQSVRRIEVPSLEALTLAVAEHERESRVHRLLAEALVQAAVDHLAPTRSGSTPPPRSSRTPPARSR